MLCVTLFIMNGNTFAKISIIFKTSKFLRIFLAFFMKKGLGDSPKSFISFYFDNALSFLLHQLIVLWGIIRKYLWIESLDEIGEKTMRLKTTELTIRSLGKITE